MLITGMGPTDGRAAIPQRAGRRLGPSTNRWRSTGSFRCIDPAPRTSLRHRESGDVRLCTIAAKNYLATATLLARSFVRQHPMIPVTVLVVDGDDQLACAGFPFEVMVPSQLDLDPQVFGRMATYYDVTELSTALKPYLLEALIGRGADAVMYLDPDIEVFAPMQDLFRTATEHGIVLTPHVLSPIPRDGLLLTEESFLRAGQFNLGFIAVGRKAGDFLQYWKERTRLFALADCDQGYFMDQRWVDAVPALFEHVVVRDRGCNVAYWNLHERELTIDPHGWSAGGQPLRFFHYSGHDASEPFRLSRHLGEPARVRVGDSAALRQLLYERSERMVDLDGIESSRRPYGFARAADGTRLVPWIRRAYWRAVQDAELAGASAPPHAFEPERGTRFLDWLREDVGATKGLSRHLFAYWSTRPDLKAAFPEPLGADGPEVVNWAAVDQTFALVTPPSLRVVTNAPGGGPGVNLVGYHAGQFGVGEAGRLVARMARAAGVPTATTTLYPPEHVHTRPDHVGRTDAPFDVSILSINADRLLELAGRPMFAAHADRRRIGVWYWEVGALPEEFRAAFDLVDEVWCASEHVRSTLAPFTDLPVVKHPVVIDAPARRTALTLGDLGLPEDRFIVGFAFDYLSVARRKNPLGLIDAYCRAFGPDDGATLVIKTLNGFREPVRAAEVLYASDRRPDIVVIDHCLPRVELRAFFQLLDCYVSLHRSEGFGLTLAAAMAAGTPCIATGWSGNLEFMDEETSMLVPYELVDVGEGAGPYARDARWADPDLNHAAEAMRRLFDDRDHAAALGARGRASILERHGAERAAAWFLERLGWPPAPTEAAA